MSNIATPRYGYDPKIPFAATRACAERRARETAAANDKNALRTSDYLCPDERHPRSGQRTDS